MSSDFLVSQLQHAVLDANVLYPAPMRDLLMTLAARALYLPRWTQAIHDEWVRNVLKNLPHVTPERLERTKLLMLEHVPQAMVTDFEHLIEGLKLPDPNDRHVLAAAIHAKAKLIVTNNIKDFPKPILEHYAIQIVTPDVFIMLITSGVSGSRTVRKLKILCYTQIAKLAFA